MNLDARLTNTKAKPMFGCHSDLDHHRDVIRTFCDYKTKAEERCCEGCKRRESVEPCGRVNGGYPCELPKGSHCPDCKAIHDFGGPD